MRNLKTGLVIVCLAMMPVRLMAARTAETAIRQVLAAQEAAWNRGDVEEFMHGYEDSPETTFIGKSVEHGYAQILARYKRVYAGKAAMGTLEFSDLSVRMLGGDHAVVTGRFHLDRDAAAGGEAKGVFSLVFEREDAGWKIILDHTTSS
ncbi:uncharacterized protein (TIGR02246 family) [Acidipila rosea]|uniref:Uncharacterized protein (TIGR02246 family) n=2 Tax=Acidipila rosea TaxID=768535 RepID=A0A4R1L197_9BACT|nr:uncharacterized protein (TIGR02246 family) [Acidipila rosea]